MLVSFDACETALVRCRAFYSSKLVRSFLDAPIYQMAWRQGWPAVRGRTVKRARPCDVVHVGVCSCSTRSLRPNRRHKTPWRWWRGLTVALAQDKKEVVLLQLSCYWSGKHTDYRNKCVNASHFSKCLSLFKRHLKGNNSLIRVASVRL